MDQPQYVITPPAQASAPVLGSSARFPVRRIFCVGRNYADHAREMGHDPDREPPFFFTKPADALLTDGADLPFPSATEDLHHEAELVVALGQGGRDIAVEDAAGLIWGAAAGIDFTRRDLQAEAKRMSRPWDMSKGFDHSAALGALTQGPAPEKGRIWLSVDGEMRQDADLSDLIWSIPEVIAHLSRLVALAPGDLIFTGTPAGVSAVTRGQQVKVGIEGLAPLDTRIV
ncbi:fumarylacetoacetate hydrolase family protein [Paracoccus sp. PARArs4]|nr:fumarylacetoacetate hydrolase family protein [Paracoccus sp. PARArs4]